MVICTTRARHIYYYINMSIIYDGSLNYKSKYLPPRYDMRSYHLQKHKSVNYNIVPWNDKRQGGVILKINEIVYTIIVVGFSNNSSYNHTLNENRRLVAM